MRGVLRLGWIGCAAAVVFGLYPMTGHAANCSYTSMATLGLDGTPAGYVRSADKLAELLAVAATVVPRDASGAPSPTGKIGMLSIGHSQNDLLVATGNAWYYDAKHNPSLIWPITVAQGMTAPYWMNGSSAAWTAAMNQVHNRGLADAQVQVLTAMMTQGTPGTYGILTEAQLRAIAATAKQKLPSLQFIIFLDRFYAGYSNGVSTLGPEPSAHDESLLYAQVVTATGGSSIGVGWPVPIDVVDIWSDGLTPNPQTGISYACGDFTTDGIHLLYAPNYQKGTRLKNIWMADPVFCRFWNKTC